MLGRMNEPSEVILTPSQSTAFRGARSAHGVGNVVVLYGAGGTGKTTVLEKLHAELGGRLVSCADVFEACESRHPLSIEEGLMAVVGGALDEHDVVLVDDWHVMTAALTSCHFNPRSGWVKVPSMTLAQRAEAEGKLLLVASGDQLPGPLNDRAYRFPIGQFEGADYDTLLTAFLDTADRARVDIDKVHRFAPKLSAQQLHSACAWLRARREPGTIDTEGFIEYLRQQRLTSNVALSEVQAVDLRDLKGIDDVIESLEANIVLPLEDDELAERLGLEPKRGVLLAGPPGTGKTTVGRALAHRLRGKFFLIDGTFISGTRGFYQNVHKVFRMAQENAPAVVFIDDSDVVFESGQEHGLYRYLLTMLDGLQSASASRVCVMMTAMDVSNIPPAMVRSGRVELWLETRLPDAAARAAILETELAAQPEEIKTLDMAAAVEATDGFTGADLKRTLGDAKMLYAFDLSRGREPQSMTHYVQQAARVVQTNREKYLDAERRSRAARPVRPPWFGGSTFGMDFDETPIELTE